MAIMVEDDQPFMTIPLGEHMALHRHIIDDQLVQMGAVCMTVNQSGYLERSKGLQHGGLIYIHDL